MRTRFATTSLVAIAVSVALCQVQAAEATRDKDELTEITITATRQNTNLQETPIAITAVTGEMLKDRNLTDTADLGFVVPNATFRDAQGAFGKAVTAFIRGIGQGDSNLAAEPGVAFYIDDVYYPLLFGSSFDLLDLDHVEVLRGPQGTLFGRNALAGAINIVSKEPNMDPSAYAEATVGAFNRHDLRGGFNIPIGDTMALRVTGLSKRRQGYEKQLDFRCEMIKRGTPALAGNFPFSEGLKINTQDFTPDNCTIGTLGGEDLDAVRAQLLWKTTDRLKITLTGDWSQDNSTGVADRLIAVNATTAFNNASLRNIANTWTTPGGPTFAYDSRFVTGDKYTTYATYGDPIAAGTVIAGAPFYNGTPTRGGFRYSSYSPVLNWGVSGKAVFGVTDNIDLTMVGGYRKIDTVFSFDVDGSPIALENTRNNTGEDHTSGEIRLTGRGNLIDWTGGIFYYRGHGFVHTALASPYNNLQRLQNNLYEPESKAAYANLVIKPLDKLSFTLGGRYSDDTKPVTYQNRQEQVPTGDIVFNVEPKDSRFDWKLGAEYQLLDYTMVYASAATGFRLPSFNSRPLQPSQVTQIPGDEILNYEMGIKTDLFDRMVRINGDIFYTDYKTRPAGVSGQEYRIGANGQPDPGNSVTIPLVGGPPDSTTCRARTAAEITGGVAGFTCIGRTYYINTPGIVRGAEMEVEARPLDHLSFNMSLGYQDFQSHDINAPTRVNKRLLGVPDWTGSMGVQYDFETPALGGSISPRLDWYYQGSIAYSASSKTYNQNPYSTVNLRVTYQNNAHDVTVSLGATNLLDHYYYRNFFIYQELGYPNVNAQPAPPREWFLTIGKSF
jgi:iron complex outermembrane receptor protein